MALKKNFSTGTKYYYVRIGGFAWDKDNTVAFRVQKRVRDTADEESDSLETESSMIISAGHLTDSNDRWNPTNLNVADENFLKACYEFLKSDIEEFSSGWADV